MDNIKVCKYCQVIFDNKKINRGFFGNHVRWCSKNPKVMDSKVAYDFKKLTEVKIKKIYSQEERLNISNKRKEWLAANPDKHPWRSKDKFVSKPCEFLKNYLREQKIEFVEEAIISQDKNYSVDILIESKNLILEVNGNQHYDSSGNLREYYQKDTIL